MSLQKQIDAYNNALDFYNEVESSLKAEQEAYCRFASKYPIGSKLSFSVWLDYQISDAIKAVRNEGNPVTVEAVVANLLN